MRLADLVSSLSIAGIFLAFFVAIPAAAIYSVYVFISTWWSITSTPVASYEFNAPKTELMGEVVFHPIPLRPLHYESHVMKFICGTDLGDGVNYPRPEPGEIRWFQMAIAGQGDGFAVVTHSRHVVMAAPMTPDRMETLLLTPAEWDAACADPNRLTQAIRPLVETFEAFHPDHAAQTGTGRALQYLQAREPPP